MTNTKLNKGILSLLLALSIASCCSEERVEKAAVVAPAMYSVSADEIKKSESGPHLLPSVHFALNKATLSKETIALLNDTIIPEATSPNTDKVVIEAHCDERGTDAYNQTLSEKRAEAVKDYLVKNGVAADKIKAVGYGKTKPIAEGHNEEAWSQNRRAVTIVIKE